jgi:hypothetical protein
MFRYKIVLPLLLTTLFVIPAYCQIKSESHQIKIISGTVIDMDAVGNVITIQADPSQTNQMQTYQAQMAFYVPDKVTITHETHDVGLLDIRKSDPVTIQYYVSSPGKYVVVSIVDNKPAGPD